METGRVKQCSRCHIPKALNEDNFYLARPRDKHKGGGWQSYCRDCWKDINRQNKINLKTHKKLVSSLDRQIIGSDEFGVWLRGERHTLTKHDHNRPKEKHDE